MDTAPDHRLDLVVADLQRVFHDRLEAVVAYGPASSAMAASLVLVASLDLEDLTAMAGLAPQWHRSGAATPLVMPRSEFARSLDAFPIEYGEIIDTHVVLVGQDPFAGVRIDPLDTRRAVEVQAASHVLHLRENYVEQAARPAAIADLVRESAPGFRLLLRRMAQLDGAPADTPAALAAWASQSAGLDARVVGDVLALAGDNATGIDGARLFPGYLAAAEALVHAIDQWRAS